MRPPIELRKTTRPRASRIIGSIACVTATCEIRLTSSCWRRSSSGIVSSGDITAMPALLTSPSSPLLPTAAVICSETAVIWPASVTSSISGTSRSEAALRKAAASSSLRTLANTRQPSASIRRALARPMPVEAPVIRTVFTGARLTSLPMAETAFVTGGSGFIGGKLVQRLRGEGRAVRALARSDEAAERVAELGAEPVRGDLGDPISLTAGADCADVAFHLAAHLGEWGPWEDFERGNVVGTRNVLAGCREAGVRRFVHCGTEAALMAGEPLVHVDETAPLRPDSRAPYPATKAKAEQTVRQAARDGFETVAVRPRFVWGKGDTTLLPEMVATVEAGRFAWVGGGRNVTDTAHVDNVVEGLVLAAEKGRPGEAYFLTDGEPVVFREFVSAMLRTQD